MSQTGLWGQLGLALQKERDAYHQLFALLSEELPALRNHESSQFGRPQSSKRVHASDHCTM